MNAYGTEFERYLRRANDDVAVVVMAETKEAVANIDGIVGVEGVDAVFIGPYDLSGSYGIPGQTDHPVVLEACDTVVAACRAAGKSAGLHVVAPSPESIQRAVRDGFTFIALGVDTVFLQMAAAEALAEARKAVGH